MEEFYKRQENLILRATEEFAKVHNVHYSTMTKNMIKNAMREMRRVVLDEVANTKTGTDNAVLPEVVFSEERAEVCDTLGYADCEHWQNSTLGCSRCTKKIKKHL